VVFIFIELINMYALRVLLTFHLLNLHLLFIVDNYIHRSLILY